jgi:hypothetical protein
MTRTRTASQRFPLAWHQRQGAATQARWTEELDLQSQVKAFRAQLMRVLGMSDEQWETAQQILMGKLVPYAEFADAFESVWSELGRGVSVDALWTACQGHRDVRQMMTTLGIPMSVEGLGVLLRCAEFAAWRRDKEFLECLAANKAALERMPEVMASQIAREHRYWEARRRVMSIKDSADQAQRGALDDLDVDENDIAAAMAALGKSNE